MHTILSGFALALATSISWISVANAAPASLLPNGFKGVMLGDSQAQSLQKFEKIWAGSRWRCHLHRDFAPELVTFCASFAGENNAKLPYAGLNATRAFAYFDNGLLVEINLEFALSGRTAEFTPLSEAIDKLLGRPSVVNYEQPYLIWDNKTEFIKTAFTAENGGVSSFRYGAYTFALKKSRVEQLKAQVNTGL